MLFERRTCALLIAALGVAITGAAANAAEEGDRAAVTVRLGATYRSGAVEFARGGSWELLSIGETTTVTLKAGLPPGGGLMTSYSDAKGTTTATPPPARGGVAGGLVAGGPTTPPPPPSGAAGGSVVMTPAADYVWTLKIRLVSVAPGSVTFNVNWKRTGPAGREEEDERTITLRPDDRHLLDFLRTDNRGVANLFVELTAARIENPVYADLAISYDLWLVHETASGQKITRRANVVGGQGDAVKFQFYPILFPVGAGQPVDGERGEVRMLVRGLITGRAKGDGTIELVVRTERTVGPASRTGGLPGEIGGGEKVIVVRGDETTSIELPPGESMFNLQPEGTTPAALRPGVARGSSGRLEVYQRQFLAGTKTSLLITLRGGFGGIVRGGVSQ